MPGYDEHLPIPPHLEPPRLDADETLPSQLHPSYPFGRGVTKSRVGVAGKGKGVGNLLGTVGTGGAGAGPAEGSGSSGKKGGMGAGVGMGMEAFGFGFGSGRAGRGEGWDELGMEEVVEKERYKEVPPGMAVSACNLTTPFAP